MSNRKFFVVLLVLAAVVLGLGFGIFWTKSQVDVDRSKPKQPTKVVVVDSTGKAVEQPPAAK